MIGHGSWTVGYSPHTASFASAIQLSTGLTPDAVVLAETTGRCRLNIARMMMPVVNKMRIAMVRGRIWVRAAFFKGLVPFRGQI